ncbi:Sorbitol-6-phosphate 2-dehydrogenase [Candidatus Rhodobacter oscarellae]|uniref:Sorbitol-6-phosphate 2-dehydrogenase n=1 Tax=Candidatus Rhodobacter oscarellae TaxID=1675527 RepID=A0A0J9E9R8_9RHOB|nr:SDR family NAD(P)-dependent oxidoreductase [Candidatus Rhodobacter lobularis]KMW59530.1 Sorbitol-6-phosphate 2-dehydrogenase [Candidatus Rhodobacter lobularis]
MSETWIILGATSTMARVFARELAGRGDGVLLAGRDMVELELLAQDCALRGAPIAEAIAFDARDAASFAPIIDRAAQADGTISAAVFVGSMPDQSDIDADPSLVDGTVIDSFTGPARFLQMLAPLMEERGAGTVVGISSVAGDRGRLANYVYGAAKAGFSTYLSGLRNRMGRKGVHVVTVKPGPVDTAMTWGLGKMPFMTTPEAAVTDILKAVRKRRNVIYTAGIWRIVMAVIRSVPEPIFKKMSI